LNSFDTILLTASRKRAKIPSDKSNQPYEMVSCGGAFARSGWRYFTIPVVANVLPYSQMEFLANLPLPVEFRIIITVRRQNNLSTTRHE
jgi:hypothetical protein